MITEDSSDILELKCNIEIAELCGVYEGLKFVFEREFKKMELQSDSIAERLI